MSGRTIYDGEIHKCPSCGATLSSFAVKCSICDIELRGVETVKSATDLVALLDSVERKRGVIDDNTILEREIWIIENFPIPNTKEDILEFIVLAASHIDMSKANAENDKLMQAWKKKFEQAYYKARIIFGDSVEFQRVEKIHKEELIKPKRNKIMIFLAPIALFVLLAIVIAVSIGIKNKEKEQSESVLNLTTAQITVADEDILGAPYQDVVAVFKSLGFTNIETKEFPHASNENGEVVSVSINGSTNFSVGDRFAYETKIIINYRIITPIELTVSSEEWVGQDYQDAIEFFKRLGFANVQAIANKTTEGRTAEISKITINGISHFNIGDSIQSNAQILVYYNVLTHADLIFSSEDLLGQEYNAVIKKFELQGFTNIETIAWKEAETDEGKQNDEVEKVVINGISGFDSGTSFPLNAKVTIYYRVITSAKLDFSFSKVEGKKYTTVTQMFEDLGFTNITYKTRDRLFNKNEVYKIEINGKANAFKEGNRFALDSEIVIYYNV